MSAVVNREAGNTLPHNVSQFLEKDWIYFRLWALIFALSVFAFSGFQKIKSESRKISVIEGKVSQSLATDLARLYLVFTHEDPNSISNVEYHGFNTISSESGGRFFQVNLNYREKSLDGSSDPVQKEIFFDDSGWAQGFVTMN